MSLLSSQVLGTTISKLDRRWTGHSCVLVGFDGIDPCVTTNLVLLYTLLGFNVAISRKPTPCDLVVFMRYPSASGECLEKLVAAILPDTPVHIYSYVGESAQALSDALTRHQVTHFAPSRPLLVRDRPGLDQRIALPPVFPELWSRQIQPAQILLTHIGNCKSRGELRHSWLEEQQLIAALRDPKSHLWGSHGWENVTGVANWHGALPHTEVSTVYSLSACAIGLMYPFQRSAGTYSSRLWQAPLNGCPVISEVDTPLVAPGIKPLGLDNAVEKAEGHRAVDRHALQQEAISFWLQARAQTVQTVSSALQAAMRPESLNLKNVELTEWKEDPFMALLGGEVGDGIGYHAIGAP